MAEAPPSTNTSSALPSLSLEQAPFPMATVGGSTHIVRYVNPAFCFLMEKPAEDLVGKPLSELLPTRDQCVTLIKQVTRTGRPVSHTEKDPSKPHSVFWSYTMWPLLTDELLVGVMIQVTESSKTHQSTVEMNEALVLGSLRQHELTEAAEDLNRQLRTEIVEHEKTARDLAEKARLLDLSHDGIIVRNLAGCITYWNHGAEEIYGWTAEEALGKISDELFQTEFPGTMEKMKEELHLKDRWTGELVHTRRDGQRITVLVRKTLDRDSEGNPASVLQNITDISESKQAEKALLEAGERFRFMAESMPQKIFTATPDGSVEYLNRQWEEFTGMTSEDMLGWGWVKFNHPDDLEETLRLWKKAMVTGENFELEHRFRRKDEKYRWHLSRAFAMRDSEGTITLWVGSSTDIDDMMQAQVELMDAEAQLADRAVQLERLVNLRTGELTSAHLKLMSEADERKRLESEVAGSIEGERERLGHDLHDGVVQELTGITMMLQALSTTLRKLSPAHSQEADRLCRLLETAHEHARDLAKNFFPVELEQHGLYVALEGIAQRTEQQFGISCLVDCDAPEALEALEAPEEKDVISVQLFRIAQEAVQNAIKHARAKTILIHLSKSNGSWLLRVRDDGIGLPDDPINIAGMGIRIMQYRARIMDGTLTVENADGGGVLVTCTAPAREKP